MKHRLFALFVGCFALSMSSQATTLFGVVNLSTDFSGNAVGDQVWNTVGGDGLYNLYLDEGSGFVNTGDGAGASVNILLTPGVHTFSIYGEPGLSSTNWGLNLFFNGNASTPGISARNLQGAAAALAVANGGSTFALDGTTSVAGANTLTFIDGGTIVTLTGYSWNLPASADLVSGFDTTPSGNADFFGSFTLEVTSDIPEPAAWQAGLLGLAMLAAHASLRRKLRR